MIVQYSLAKVYLAIRAQETLTMQSQILNFDYLMIYDSLSLSGTGFGSEKSFSLPSTSGKTSIWRYIVFEIGLNSRYNFFS